MSNVRIFVSYDIEHDADLLDEIRRQSAASGFEVSGCSQLVSGRDFWSEGARREIRGSDLVIFLCGERTEDSKCMSAELQISNEEQIPHFMLWGRAGMQCTKPHGSKSHEGMYSWTRPILLEQIALIRRSLGPAASPGSGKEPS